jgi:hypothetical protein
MTHIRTLTEALEWLDTVYGERTDLEFCPYLSRYESILDHVGTTEGVPRYDAPYRRSKYNPWFPKQYSVLGYAGNHRVLPIRRNNESKVREVSGK